VYPVVTLGRSELKIIQVNLIFLWTLMKEWECVIVPENISGPGLMIILKNLVMRDVSLTQLAQPVNIGALLKKNVYLMVHQPVGVLGSIGMDHKKFVIQILMVFVKKENTQLLRKTALNFVLTLVMSSSMK